VSLSILEPQLHDDDFDAPHSDAEVDSGDDDDTDFDGFHSEGGESHDGATEYSSDYGSHSESDSGPESDKESFAAIVELLVVETAALQHDPADTIDWNEKNSRRGSS
jgi:hypothetical protein